MVHITKGNFFMFVDKLVKMGLTWSDLSDDQGVFKRWLHTRFQRYDVFQCTKDPDNLRFVSLHEEVVCV